MTAFSRSRLTLGAVAAAAVAAVAVVASSLAGRVAAQDPSLKPTYGEQTLKVGFAPDPFKVKVEAGGELQTKLGGVTAWVGKAPDFRLGYTAGKLPLTFRVECDEDTTLLINLPDGKWIADDDSGGRLNPRIHLKEPRSGTYEIWVGTIARGKTPKATLFITELK